MQGPATTQDRATVQDRATAAPDRNATAPQPSADPKPVAGPATADPKPVARLATAGPDGPRRYADADLGGSWFAKPQSAPVSPAPAPVGADTSGSGKATETRTAAEATMDPAAPAEATAEPDNGLVLDFDITGLVNGLGTITGEQPAVTPHRATAGTATGEQPAIARPGTTTGEQPTVTAHQSATGEHPAVTPGATTAAPPAEQIPAPGGELKPLSAADLEAIRWRLDGGTLREVVDDRDALRELGERLDEPIAAETDHVARAGLLSVRAEVYRLLGELGMAAAASRLALAHAETAGDAQALVISQAELAHVLRLRGDFAEADRLFEQAASSEAPEVLRSVVHENAGRCCFDQGRHMEALDHFGRAVRLGRPDDTDLAERIEVSLEAVYIHVLRDGWGPYPRLRREIISSRRPDPAGGGPG